MKTLHVIVSNKIATYQKRDGAIVCGNTGYQIQFTFDAEWSAHASKKARFIWNGMYLDSPFTGDTVVVPAIKSAEELEVGVYVDDNLCTTTSAKIPCNLSILSGSPVLNSEEGKHYADAAMENAANAARSADEAKTYATHADVASNSAVSSASRASTYATNAKNSATAAANSATSAASAAETKVNELAILKEPNAPKQYITGDVEITGSITVGGKIWGELNESSGSVSDQIEELAVLKSPNAPSQTISQNLVLEGNLDVDGTIYMGNGTVRAVHGTITDGNVPQWDASKGCFVDSGVSLGDISSALDELHAYAQALAGGTTV